MRKPSDRNFLEAFLMNGEAVIDTLTENEAIRSVPVIGTAIKMCKGLDDIRNKAVAAKLAKFLADPSLRHERVAGQLQEKITADEKMQERIGETLFLVIEKITSLEKPSLLAKIFAAYLADVINAETMLRLAHAIDIAYIDDIQSLLQAPILPDGLGTEWKLGLVSAGLVAPTNSGAMNGGGIRYALTGLAHELQRAYKFALDAA